jgi:hypothetical protein
MILFGILSIIAGILILYDSIRSSKDWDAPLSFTNEFKGWIGGLGFIIMGIKILYENL